MKNSLFYDLMHEMRNQLRKHYGFSAEHGGFLTDKQKEQLKKDIFELVDSFPVMKDRKEG